MDKRLSLEVLPGYLAVADEREYIYITDGGSDFETVFRRITNAINPPNAKSGGAISERYSVVTPQGVRYHTVSYRGDLYGWKKDLTLGAGAFDLDVAFIDRKNAQLVLSCGEKINLADCKVIFE